MNLLKNIEVLGTNYVYLAAGLTRVVYVNADFTKVVKVDVQDYMSFNTQEHFIYKNASEEDRMFMARTWMIDDKIFQEYLKPVERKLSIDEILFSMSCGNQTGLNPVDRLVCYDLDEYRPRRLWDRK